MVISVKEAAEELGVDRITIYRYIKRGLKTILITQGIRKVMRIDKDVLYAYVSDQQQKQKGKE